MLPCASVQSKSSLQFCKLISIRSGLLALSDLCGMHIGKCLIHYGPDKQGRLS